MATAPASRKLNLTRDQLAAFLTDHQQIKQFELLFSVVDVLEPIVGTDFIYQADTAAANANNALAQIRALAQDTAVDDAVLNAKVQQALDAISRLAQALDLLSTAPRQEIGTIAPQNSDNVNITGGLISGLDAPLPVASGGIGVTTAPANRVFAGPTTGANAPPAFRALVAGDVPALTTGSDILYGNGSGGFSNVTIGSGVSFTGGTLSASGTGGTVTAVTGTAPVLSSGGTTPDISMAAATALVPGYLTSTDWNTFNNKSNTNGTVTSVAALTLGTTGTDLSSTVANSTTTPVITLQVPTASAANRGALSSADWSIFNGKQPAGTYVTSVSVASTNGLAGTSSGGATPTLTLSTSVTGLLKGNGTAISAASANIDYQGIAPPVTKTADFTVANGDIWHINNKSGSTCVVTLPAAASWSGRTLTFKNMQAQLLNSASSNVAPIDSTTPGTAILLNVVGNWASLVSDGTNWIIMQQAPNNILLLE